MGLSGRHCTMNGLSTTCLGVRVAIYVHTGPQQLLLSISRITLARPQERGSTGAPLCPARKVRVFPAHKHRVETGSTTDKRRGMQNVRVRECDGLIELMWRPQFFLSKQICRRSLFSFFLIPASSALFPSPPHSLRPFSLRLLLLRLLLLIIS